MRFISQTLNYYLASLRRTLLLFQLFSSIKEGIKDMIR